MKKKTLIIIGLLLIIFIGLFLKLDSDLGKSPDTYRVEHSLNEKRLILISDSISPNTLHRYYEYHFDKGTLGYSRVFWSVIVNDSNNKNLEKGIIPNGYKSIGWNSNNELMLKKWKTYYSSENKIKIELESGSEFNGVRIIIIE